MAKILRPCAYPGCCQLVERGYCPEHRPKQAERKESAAWHNWYFKPIWRNKLRPAQLLKQPFCETCAAKGLRVRAVHVDHKEDHKGDWSKFIDPKNLRSLCSKCHSKKTMTDRWKRVKR